MNKVILNTAICNSKIASCGDKNINLVTDAQNVLRIKKNIFQFYWCLQTLTKEVAIDYP